MTVQVSTARLAQDSDGTANQTHDEFDQVAIARRHWKQIHEQPLVIASYGKSASQNGNRELLSHATEGAQQYGRTDLPAPAKSRVVQSESFRAIQEWEGCVTRIDDDTFAAQLTDRTAGKTLAEEEADFPIDDVSEDDRQLLTLGAVFRWVVGYQRSASGTKKRVSQIVFRRLPMLTERDAKIADEEGARRSAAFQCQ